MSNRFKLVCIDLDGTFLTSKRKLDEKTLKYVKELHQKGVAISIATGRASFDAKFHADQVGEGVYYIASNGATLGRNDATDLVYEERFSQESIDRVVEVSKKLKIKPVFYTRDNILVWGPRNLLVHLIFVVVAAKQLLRYLKFFFSFKSVQSFWRKKSYPIQKVIYYTRDNQLLHEIKKELKEEMFDIAITDDSCIEVTPKSINKARGVKELIGILGISQSDVIAFGDSENDVEMLKFVGCGVAVGNACQKAKDNADEVCDTNDESGIYKKLKEVFERDN